MKRYVLTVWVAVAVFGSALEASTASAEPIGGSEAERPLTRIGFGSCSSEQRAQPIWDVVLDREPELFILAGDNVYGDTDEPAVLREKYDLFAAVPGFARLRRQARLLATWDDHDYGRNDAGAEYAMKRDSQQIFLDFLGVPSDSPRRQREGVYHAETFGPEGQRTQVILLDTRYHRSELERFAPRPGQRRGDYKPSSRRDATMLGEAQWAWLEEQLSQPADLRLIVSSIQFVAEDHRFEKWINLPRERQRMLRLIRDTGASGVVFLSGDRHHAELSRLAPGIVDYPLYDLTASGLNQSRPRRGGYRPPEANRHRIQGPFRGEHFGMLHIDWDQPVPMLSLEIVDGQGESVIADRLQLDEISRDRIPDDVVSRMPPQALDRPTIDGSLDDWTVGSAIKGDQSYLYGRFETPTLRTLRRYRDYPVLMFDLDNDSATGAALSHMAGVDLQIEIAAPSEPVEGRRQRSRTVATAYLSDGRSVRLDDPPALRALDFQIAPTHASRRHEFRLSRAAAGTLGLPVLTDEGTVRMAVALADRETGATQLLLTDEAVLPAYAAPREASAAVAMPAKAGGAVRLMAINVLWGEPLKNPEPFARIFSATEADIYLIQEWERGRYSEAEICAWFREHVDAEAPWAAMVTGSGGRGAGTAVVTALPLSAKLPAFTPVATERWNFPARISGAAVQTPVGDFVVGNVHFKAGGALGSAEDTRRLAEADAVNRLLLGLSAAVSPEVVVLGGDYNLNGSTSVVEVGTRGLDLDRSPLTTATPHVLGRPGLTYTHGRGPFKNRLDFISYSDSSAEVTASFVLDTQVLSESSLRRMGLERDDTDATDHLPVVVDLRPRRVSGELEAAQASD
ncbi:MAG: alkaline phosphatase D family protein [Planctomycetota bacterium]